VHTSLCLHPTVSQSQCFKNQLLTYLDLQKEFVSCSYAAEVIKFTGAVNVRSYTGKNVRSHRVFNRPVGEPRGITEMTEVVDVTEEFVLELRENDDGDWTVLVQSPSVTL